ncbi:hypothetical protein CCMSSC00406_0010093 [Pleurotus cornucopiae]|uniref:Uncharacterized protein n=1 Tax=Pleurotus cornucopiae TaxID=5321 RepID=A0ACB7IK45_PLECO|nr:hypothetical protein CCMSSC00406_0010093 [Pleurotus cornucopiae]
MLLFLSRGFDVSSLMTHAGFRELVATIVGLWQWETPTQAGYDPCMTHSHVSPNHAFNIPFLIEEDAASKWRSVEQSPHRPGEQAPRAPVDDLESFVWVLLYELLYWAPNRTLVEITWWNLLNTDGVTKMIGDVQAPLVRIL